MVLPDPIFLYIIFTGFMVLERDFLFIVHSSRNEIFTPFNERSAAFCFELRFEYDFPCLARG